MSRGVHRLMSRQDEDGSVLLLALGYVVLALMIVLVCVEATGLYLAQKRLDALADAAALAAADGFTLSVVAGEPVAILSDDGVRAEAASLIAQVGGDAVLVSASTPDGVSARVSLARTWTPVILGVIVPAGVTLESTATTRTGLN